MLTTVRMIAPGTPLRAGISLVLQMGHGALIVLGDSKKILNLTQGGFDIDVPFLPARLSELCKMDGAIIISENGKRIIAANKLLVPDHKIPSNETGTRHQAAERMAIQTGATVVAISEQLGTLSVFCGTEKKVMTSIPAVLNKANQSLQALEKYLSVLRDNLEDLDLREFQSLVTMIDVARVIQCTEMIRRMAKDIANYLNELGIEGRTIRLQLEQQLNEARVGDLVINDYYVDTNSRAPEHVMSELAQLSDDQLLNTSDISTALGYGANIRTADFPMPRGYRILSQTHRLSNQVIDNLVRRFGNLQNIVRASHEELVSVKGVGDILAERLRAGLTLLQSQVFETQR